MRWCDGSLSKILSLSDILIVSWWSWWESHPCLKSYWTTYSAYAVGRFKYIYNAWEKKEPCDCPCTSIPKILGLRTSHESSSPSLSMRKGITLHLTWVCQTFKTATLAHNIPTSESLGEGVTLSFHLRSFHYLRTTLPAWECLGSISCGHKLWHHLIIRLVQLCKNSQLSKQFLT